MVAIDNGLANQIKVTDIISSYPQNTSEGVTTSIGAIAKGAAVDGETTKQISSAAFAQGQFFKAFSKINFDQLSKTDLGNGDEAWSYTQSIAGTDHNVVLKKSDILSSVTLTEPASQAEIDAIAKQYNIDPQETYIVVDGKKYFIRMNVPMHFGTGNQNNIIVDTLIFVVGTTGLSAAIAGVIATLGIDAFATALASINTQVFTVLWSIVAGVAQVSYVFIQAFVGAIVGGETVVVALATGQAAVGVAVAEGAFSAITAAALAYTVVGILVIAAIFLIFTFALHYSYHNVYIYNLTKYDLDFDFGYIYEGNAHNVESKHLPAYQKRTGPNNIDLGSWYSATAFRFQSDSKFYGLGYALSLTLKTPGVPSIYKQMACMFDIPYVGDNSLRASATLPGDIKNFYSSNEGVIKQTQNSASDNELELIVTYDYLSGTHLDPESGDQEYIYNSLVILREKNAVFSLTPSASIHNNSYFSIPSNPAYQFGKNDFTLEAWIKPASAGTLFGKKSTEGGDSSKAGFLFVLQPNGALKLAMDNGYGYCQIISVSTAVFDGNWHHVAATRRSATSVFYLDGQELNSTLTGSLPSPLDVNNNLELLIGAVQQNQESHMHYSGNITEARVWNIGLQTAQILQGMNSALAGNEPGLVGYWPLHANGVDNSITHNNASPVGNIPFTS